MTFTKITLLGGAALMLGACADGNTVGVGATYDNSVEIATLNLSGNRTLDCLSGPWKNTIWYDQGVVKNADGTQVAENTKTDQAADAACREYFNAKTRGQSSQAAGALALGIFNSLS